MRLLFLNPIDIYVNWPFRLDFSRYLYKIPAVSYPQLAASLADRPIDIAVCDGLVEKLPMHRYKDILAGARIIGINVTDSCLALNSEITIRLIKRVNPEATVVIGGHHASLYDDMWVRKGADVVVRGEGDRSFPLVIDALTDGGGLGDVRGITFRGDDGEPVRTADQDLIEDLDEIEMPRWEIIDLDHYDLGIAQEGRTASLEMSRGCTHRCTFCCTHVFWGGGQRLKSPDRVVEEFRRLRAMGVRQIDITDDSWGESSERYQEISEAIIRNDLGLSWVAFCRADLAVDHPEVLEVAARAGLKQVLVGFETLGDRGESMLNKEYPATSVDYYRKAYENFHRYGIFVHGLFVFGYPGLEQSDNRFFMQSPAISDAAGTRNFTPIRHTPGFQMLRNRGIDIVEDAFYTDRYLPPYTDKGKPQVNRTLLYNMIYFFSPWKFIKLLSGSKAESNFYRRFFGHLIWDVLKVNRNKVSDFLVIINPRLTPQEKRARISRRYLNDRFVESL